MISVPRDCSESRAPKRGERGARAAIIFNRSRAFQRGGSFSTGPFLDAFDRAN